MLGAGQTENKSSNYQGHSDRQFSMASSGTLLFVCLIFIPVTQLSAQQTNFLYEYCQNDIGNYTINGTYKANLKQVLSILPSTDGNGGFYTASYGQNSDEVYAIGLCRGDVEPRDCRRCLNQSTQLVTQTCPNQKEAMGGFDECMLRYSNRSLIGRIETRPRFHTWNKQNVSSIYMDSFSQHLKTLLENLKNRAAAGGSFRKYARGNATVFQSQSLYEFAQCTPDLSQPDCVTCLDEAFGDIRQHNRSVGGRVFTPGCNFRYEVYTFYGQHAFVATPESRLQSTPVSPPATVINPKTKKGKKSKKSRTIIIAVVPSVASVVLIISLGVYSRVRKKAIGKSVESQDLPSNVAEEIGRATSLQFDISTIRLATDNLSDENTIAMTSNVGLYKGRLSDGQSIVVESFQDPSYDHFLNKIRLGAKLHHRNIVRLLGFCLKGDFHRRRFLVYEFLPMSLDRLIFGDPLIREEHPSYMDWKTRYNIVRGIASGLLYLHEEHHSTIIHRDIKASNILLDENMNPKISGFDLALSSDVDQPEVTITGTLGYLDPEYACYGTCSPKSDVFSFGVLLLEVVTGQRCLGRAGTEHPEHLAEYVRRNYVQGTVSDTVDPRIWDASDPQIMRCINVGLLCTETRRDARPSMSSVVHMLDCSSFPLPVPSQDVNIGPDSGSEISLVSTETKLDVSD